MIAGLLDFWVGVFTEELKDNTDDQLKMKVIKKAPFQDDPTREAPYIILDVNRDLGLIPEEKKYAEIGGSNYWTVHLKLRASAKLKTKPNEYYTLQDYLMQRMVYILQQNFSQHPVFPNDATMENNDWMFIDKIMPKVIGGETEWFGYIEIYFHNRIKIPGPWTPGFGTYPSEIEL